MPSQSDITGVVSVAQLKYATLVNADLVKMRTGCNPCNGGTLNCYSELLYAIGLQINIGDFTSATTINLYNQLLMLVNLDLDPNVANDPDFEYPYTVAILYTDASVGPVGPAGPTGATGTTGATGNTGAAGTAGTNGTNGVNGNDGADGSDGVNGTNGSNGLSAYQVWLSLGNVGSSTDFINSLNGTNGTNGTNGASGTAGTNGWTPTLAIIIDGIRRVQQVIDWTGGTGAKPATGLYVATTGLVSSISSATDISGGIGPTGPTGGAGPAGATGATGATGPTGATGAAGPSVWGGITGSISSQIDLYNALNGKELLSDKVTTLDNSATNYPSTSAVTTALSFYLPLSGGTLSGDVQQPNTPVNGNSLINKNYVDNIIIGVIWVGADADSTSNITLSGEQTINGVTTALSRVLVHGQTTGSQNGIYISGTGAWARSSDASTSAQILRLAVIIEGGTNKGQQWVNTNSTITLGTTAITFANNAGMIYTNGTGLLLSGTAFSIDNTYTSNGSRTGFLASADWTTFNNKQSVLSGTGFVKSTGGTISYDTSTYITGNQTVSLTGAITGSGATSIATTLASGSVGIANLSASGTASATTYLRGDNTWATVSSGGMANPMTTAGDIIYGGASGTPTRLGIGSTGQVLSVAAGIPSWTTSSISGTPNYMAKFGSGGLSVVSGLLYDDGAGLMIGTTVNSGFQHDQTGTSRVQVSFGVGVVTSVTGTPTAVATTTGGTLAAATYYYKIVSVDAVGGLSTGSTEVSVTTTGTTSKVTLNWTASLYASSYNIYRGTAAGAESIYYNTGSNITSFIDTNTSSAAGTVPLVNSTRIATFSSTGLFNTVVFGFGKNQDSSNAVFGLNAGSALLNGAGSNVFIGNKAGQSTTSGTSNIYIGSQAGINSTTAQANVCIGTNAGNVANLGYNLFFGNNAGFTNSSSYSVMIGASSGQNSSNSGTNTFIGYSTGYYATGGNNIFIGYLSGSNVASNSGTNNAGLGTNTFTLISTGSNSVAMGNVSLQYVTTGSFLTAIGAGAGRYVGSGSIQNQTSTNSVYIGASSSGSADGNTNETVIGYLSIGNGSNTVTIGNTSVTDSYLMGIIHLLKPIANKTYTVSTLPTGMVAGTVSYVTDATSPTYLGVLTGSGSTGTPVFYNGTTWLSY